MKLDPFSLISNFILWTTFFSSLLISKIRPIGQLFRARSVWIKTISFILKFLFSVVHFDLAWRVDRNSFLHLDQNSSAKCCTLLHYLLLYKSGLTNEPGGGIITLLFIVNRLLGDNGVRLCGSLIVSTVRGREFIIASTSVIRVWRDSSFKHVPWFFSNDAKILLADLIWRSHTPPMWLAAGTFLDQISQSTPGFARNWWTCWWFISLKGFFNSLSGPTKFLPLFDVILLTLLHCHLVQR